MEDLKAKSSLTKKEPVDPQKEAVRVGKTYRKARKNVWKRKYSDLWRSDAVLNNFFKLLRYN